MGSKKAAVWTSLACASAAACSYEEPRNEESAVQQSKLADTALNESKSQVISEEPLPFYDTEISDLPHGKRVQVNMHSEISKSQCISLIHRFQAAGAGGQVSVRKPAAALNGELAPWCVYNYDDSGIRFQDYIFKMEP